MKKYAKKLCVLNFIIKKALIYLILIVIVIVIQPFHWILKSEDKSSGKN